MTVSLRNCVTVCVCVCTKTGINHHSLCRPLSVLVFLSFLFQRKVLFSSESLGDENMHTDRWRRKEKEKRKRVQIWLCLLMAKGTEKVEVCVCVKKYSPTDWTVGDSDDAKRKRKSGEKRRKEGSQWGPEVKWKRNHCSIDERLPIRLAVATVVASNNITEPADIGKGPEQSSSLPQADHRHCSRPNAIRQNVCVCVLLTGTREKQSEWMSEWVSESLQFPFLLPVAVVYPSPKCFLGLLYY